MACCWYGFGKDLTTCAIAARCKDVTGRPEDTTCPHDGDGRRCELIKSKIAEANELIEVC